MVPPYLQKQPAMEAVTVHNTAPQPVSTFIMKLNWFPFHSAATTSSQFCCDLTCQLFIQVITVAVILCKYNRWLHLCRHQRWFYFKACRLLCLQMPNEPASNLNGLDCALHIFKTTVERVPLFFWSSCYLSPAGCIGPMAAIIGQSHESHAMHTIALTQQFSPKKTPIINGPFRCSAN